VANLSRSPACKSITISERNRHGPHRSIMPAPSLEAVTPPEGAVYAVRL
jgi:hypothetical protein